jgi:hypothetical protein
LIEITIEETVYEIPQVKEFTIADIVRFEKADESHKSRGIKYWAEITQIPYKALRKLGNTNYQELTYLVQQEWDSFGDKATEEALQDMSVEKVDIGGEEYSIPQNLGELPIGKISDCDLYAEANVDGDGNIKPWAYFPYMLAIMCEREGWDYEEEIGSFPESTKEVFSKANALHAMAIHFFFLGIGQGYEISISAGLKETVTKENIFAQAGTSLKNTTVA